MRSELAFTFEVGSRVYLFSKLRIAVTKVIKPNISSMMYDMAICTT